MNSVISQIPLSGAAALGLKSLPPLSVYIHIPWCLKKCPYCDFNSHELRKEHSFSEEAYVNAVIRDLESALPHIWGRQVTSVFFGGGTPSLFGAGSIDKILAAVRTLLPLEPMVEITLEANPGTFEMQKFADFHSAGINRLSIGIQSFNSQYLHALGRVHSDDEAYRAVDIAQKTFDNINLDLMYALPGQTVEDACRDVATACSFGVAHLSAYHLTLEPNTLFHRFPPVLPTDEQTADMQDQIERILREHQYLHYETSAFAHRGRESHHNRNYWLFGDYLGIGAGAHSKISFKDKIIRQMRFKQPKTYLEKATGSSISAAPTIQTQFELKRVDCSFEFMMNALRLTGGFESALFEDRTGMPITVILPQLKEAEQRGLIERDYRRITPTLMGRRFLNDLLQIFLPEIRN
ncbi:MAG: oxygen-independent coproporphyrinogen III oxidase-like protein [Nitrosomonas sp.]|nr:oxygen-independent coproporphyrinogen III oxidase-like protein [Nitrosomonas sp.]